MPLVCWMYNAQTGFKFCLGEEDMQTYNAHETNECTKCTGLS
jgi:hypothetical protein